MKKALTAALAALVVFTLAACGTTGSTTSASSPAAIRAKLQTAIVDGCSVVQPTLESLSALDAAVSAAATANGLFCTAAAAITVTSAQALVDTGVPVVVAVVNASIYIPSSQKPLIVAALNLFKLTTKNALAAFNSANASAAVATTASAAAAPAAASQ